MRIARLLPCAVVVFCLLLPNGPGALAKGAKKRLPAAPARPSGAAKASEEPDAYYGGTRLDTISAHRNALGQTVYSIAASHFDVSPRLSEMAAGSKTGVLQEEESEPPINPELPPWRRIHSDLPDPVVQRAIPEPSAFAAAPFPPTAPTTGFNFLGVAYSGLTPSDSNGSVGNDQYVETANARYQVWSLNRVTKFATSIVGPASINTLWSGFGGACQTQNSGDPIVVYDKVASRWLISQFTSSASSGVYFQCVAISTTASAAGTYYRYAFAVPNGAFGDYPHFGVWTDAYYMMAHAFGSTTGGYLGALFAAMDRTKMLAGDPGATWQVISDPTEGGHMPADLDGFALPPNGAPGIFLSLHESGMFIYRMIVDFSDPDHTIRTLQATVPVAPSTGACPGGACIPQPNTTVRLSSLGDRLMFRAAYRNYVDHESLVISHSVDPSVAGLVAGVRWYDFRLSGPPDARCPSYPCLYQQGTIADSENGRNRWMPSLAMDAAENILVGYTASGKTDGSDNHTIRYTGRAKSDPPGVMTAPEVTVATGIANSGSTRWGDYTSMSIDPADDCTFWYVSQYYLSPSTWSTQVASSAWPAGSGAGQCPAASCTVRPAAAPAIGTATVPGDNQIALSWTGIAPAPGAYDIERADGPCGSEGIYQPVGSTAGTNTAFTDTTVQGGIVYSYRVRAASDAAGRCQSALVSGCVDATATGTCSLRPSFAGASAAATSPGAICGVTVSWSPGVSSCPLTPGLKYNVFRGTTPDFVPSAANRIAACVPGPTSYLDTDNLASGATYYYVVRAEDASTGHGGECGGNEEVNTFTVPGTAYGAHRQASPGTWTDGGGDVTSFMRLNVAGPGNTADRPWRYVKTLDDPGANHTPGGGYAYRNAGPFANSVYGANVCAEMQTPEVTAAGSALNLTYWERHQIEYHWDGIAVEYSVNGGPWADVPPPSNAPAAGCALADDTTQWDPLSCTQNPPINACGYSDAKLAFNGPLAGGTTCTDFATGPLTAYAHRCHPINGVKASDAIRFRWRFTSDPGTELAGFYLDDVAITNLSVPNACLPDTCAGKPDGTACDDGIACTTGSACSAGRCHTPVPPPGEVGGVQVTGAGSTAVSWSALPGGVIYDVASSTLSDLRINGTATASCVQNNVAGTGVIDGRPAPAPGEGYYYMVRGQNATCPGTYGYSSADVERPAAAGCP